MTASEVSVSRRRLIWLLTILAATLAIAAIVNDVTRRAAGMRVATTRAAALRQAAPGTLVKAVVKLESAGKTNVYGAELLESIDATSYRETPRHIDVALNDATKVVMGSGSDINPGAIVHVTGTIDEKGTLRASQVVILTGYVRLTPG